MTAGQRAQKSGISQKDAERRAAEFNVAAGRMGRAYGIGRARTMAYIPDLDRLAERARRAYSRFRGQGFGLLAHGLFKFLRGGSVRSRSVAAELQNGYTPFADTPMRSTSQPSSEAQNA